MTLSHITLLNNLPKPSTLLPLPPFQGPMFLLLLDCLHQVCVQQPHLLEYSPQYLAALWGAAHSPLYSTCLFDSANARHSTITVSTVTAL